MATQKITMGRGRDTEYLSKLRAAQAQADADNSFMWGMQTVYTQGTGQASKTARNPLYGNSNLTTGDMVDGATGIFKPRYDDAGNQVIGDPLNTSGFLDGQTSMTIRPQTDPEVSGMQAAERMALIAQGSQYPGLNDRSQTMGF